MSHTVAAEPAAPNALTRQLPLQGVTVLDLGQIYNGPYASFLMAMSGARVIKIEPPGGENMRRRGAVGAGAMLPFAMLNSNKEFVTINLKSDAGRDLFLQMVRKADIVIENFAPGVMDKLGVGPIRLMRENPRLVYAAGSGYGWSGPYRNFLAMDLTVQAMSGVMACTGFPDRPPVKSGAALCDFFGAVHLYGAAVSALFDAQRTGRRTVRGSVHAGGGLSDAQLGARPLSRTGQAESAAHRQSTQRPGRVALQRLSRERWLDRHVLRQRSAFHRTGRGDGIAPTCRTMLDSPASKRASRTWTSSTP